MFDLAIGAIVRKEALDKVKNEVKNVVREFYYAEVLSDKLGIKRKSDNTVVTKIDKCVSDLVYAEFSELVLTHGYHFFSEEDQKSFGFPAIILDPIDGTRELIKGIGECAVSLALMKNEREGEAWIYNPFTGFELSSGATFSQPRSSSERLFGMVSRSDFDKGIFQDISMVEGVEIEPRGSIAFKLALMSSGACDFVFSRTPKSIWDIAAGTLLGWERGFSFYKDGEKINSLDFQLIEGPLLWCRDEDVERLSSIFF